MSMYGYSLTALSVVILFGEIAKKAQCLIYFCIQGLFEESRSKLVLASTC